MDTKSPPPWLIITICIASFLSSPSAHPRRELDDIAGAIDIDCGLPQGRTYTDPSTEIPYFSDEQFIETGLNAEVSPVFESDQPTWLRTVRSFPEENRNCYSLRPPEGRDKIYLIRASFMYGNYDNRNMLPEFDIYLGVNLWGSLKFDNASHAVNKEIIHVPPSDHIYICLVNTGLGTPFISALEVRHFHNSTYTSLNGSLVLYQRLDFGSLTNDIIRYSDDAYDRIWYPYNCNSCTTVNTTLTTDSVNRTDFNLPAKVMKTASRPIDELEPLSFELDTGEATLGFSIYMHFAELQILEEGESRVFDISLNGIVLKRNFAPSYLHSTTVPLPQPVRGPKLSFSLTMSPDSTLPPILNALEIYIVSPFWQSPTDQGDVDAIEDIKSTYGIQKGWQGDPCAPIHPWNGLNCSSNNGYRPYRIISLNLSSSGLRDQIPVSLSNLEMLEHLDLSNNSIPGEVPQFLSQLPRLRTLNLRGNSFSGEVPSALTERLNNGSLVLSLDGNPNLCIQSPCKKDERSIMVPVVATLVPLLVIFIALLILWKYKRNKDNKHGKSQREGSGMKLDSREFTHLEIVRITDNFRTVVGKGGFGIVYHGHLDDGSEVAVKMLSPSAVGGSAQFQTEAQLLTRIHHKNLASFIGYCNDGTTMAILYEYMAGGNLEKYISDRSKHVLSWRERLEIALDAAQGLEYLHVGCKPPIIHRDVKSSNILLNEKMQAKIADFGLSKLFPVEGKSHLSTSVVGTVGYLDPEYYTSSRLTEKSDVYSFGIVLLELITGRPAITVGHNDNTHIAIWARPLIAAGDLRSMVDPRLVGNFNTNSAWKVVEVAISCIRSISIQRPSMNHVVAELKECLETETAHEETRRSEEGNPDEGQSYSFEMNSTKGFDVEQGPQAR